MNRVCKALNIKYPIIQGPLAWLTDAKFVAAVTNAGGLGTLGPAAGQNERFRDPDPVKRHAMTVERMRNEVRKVKKLTAGTFAVNIIPENGGNDGHTKPLIKMMIEEGVPAAVYTGSEVYPEIFQMLKDHDIKIIYRAQNPTASNARAAEENGADVIVATGFDEGGTLPKQVVGTFSIVRMIVDAVDHTPVLAAGGITDRRAVKAALALGAEGVYCGSVFIASEENRTAAKVKQAIVNSTADELLLFRTKPAYYRSLPGPFADHLQELSDQGVSRDEIGKVMGGLYGLKRGMVDGDWDQGYVSLGTGITSIHEIRPVKAIIDDLMAD